MLSRRFWRRQGGGSMTVGVEPPPTPAPPHEGEGKSVATPAPDPDWPPRKSQSPQISIVSVPPVAGRQASTEGRELFAPVRVVTAVLK